MNRMALIVLEHNKKTANTLNIPLCIYGDEQSLDFDDGNSLDFKLSVSNCGGNLIASPMSQSILVPTFPDYPLSCLWDISASSVGSRINVTVRNQSTSGRSDPNCRRQYVSIYTISGERGAWAKGTQKPDDKQIDTIFSSLVARLSQLSGRSWLFTQTF